MVVAVGVAPPCARAQAPNIWAVVAASADEEPTEAERLLVGRVEAMLSDRGMTLARPDGFGARLGAIARPLAPGFREQLEREVEALLEPTAFGRRNVVEPRVQRILQEAVHQIDSIGIEPDTRRRLADLALYAIRVQLRDGDHFAATRTAETLLRLIPEPEPNPDLHPPEPLAVLREARTRMTVERSAVLAVTVEGASGPCATRINGAPAGPAPGRFPLFPGSYAVRVDCGNAPGRVHFVDVPAGETELVVYGTLETALRTRPRPRLVYASDSARESLRRTDAETLRRVWEVTDLVLVTVRRDQLRIDHLREQGVVAGGAVGLDAPIEQIASLLGIGDAVVSSAPGQGPDGARVAGYALGGVGLAGIAAAWVLVGFWNDAMEWARLAYTTDPDFFRRQSRRDEFELAVYVTGVLASATLVAALPLVIEPEREVPWWSWTLGGVGVAAMVAGAIAWSTEGTPVHVEDPALCSGASQCTILQLGGEPIGPLIIANGLTLVAVPVVHLIQQAIGVGPGVARVRVAPSGLAFSW